MMFPKWWHRSWMVAAAWWMIHPAVAQTEVEKLVERAQYRQASHDLTGALADYDLALKLKPDDAALREYRAKAEDEQNQAKATRAELDQTIKAAPDNAAGYTARAIFEGTFNDVDGAIADHTKAIELDANSAVSYSDRGLDKVSKGDLEGAASDCEKGVELAPEAPMVYRNRGIVRQMKGQWQEAAEDYRRYRDLAEGDVDYVQLYSWVVRGHLSKLEDADRELAKHVAVMPQEQAGGWTRHVAEFLLSRTKEDDLFAQARSKDFTQERGQLCEAYYFAGMKKLLAGEKDLARAAFEKCLATGKITFIEYEFAKAELARLRP